MLDLSHANCMRKLANVSKIKQGKLFVIHLPWYNCHSNCCQLILFYISDNVNIAVIRVKEHWKKIQLKLEN